MHSLPSDQLSSLVYCYRRICYRMWRADLNGFVFWFTDETPWSYKHYALRIQ
jgi:hypothetical protein